MKNIQLSGHTRRDLRSFFSVWLFVGFCLLPLVIYGGRYNFAADSYVVLMRGLTRNANWLLGQYQFGGWILNLFFDWIGHNPVTYSTPDIVFFILFVSFCMTAFVMAMWHLPDTNKIANGTVSLISLTLSVVLLIVNVAGCNALQFPECIAAGALGTGLCFLAMTVIAIGDSKKHYLISALFLVLALSFSKQMVSFSGVMLLTVCNLKILRAGSITQKPVFVYVRHAILWIGSGIIFIVITVVLQKLTGIAASNRAVLSVSGIFGNVWYFFTHQYTYWRWHSYFDTEIMLVCGVFMLFVWLIPSVKALKNKENRTKEILQMIAVMLAYVIMYIPGFLSTSKGIRTLCAVFGIYFLFYANSIYRQGRKTSVAVCLVLMLVLTLNIGKLTEAEVAQKRVNEQDKAWSENVLLLIDDYENDTGLSVDAVAFCYDSTPDRNSNSALYCTYARNLMLDTYNTENKTYNVIEMSAAVFGEYFEDKDWKGYSFDQVVIIEDTAYICIY